jgi:eukaryotic-like serine/threonine-protein kinase
MADFAEGGSLADGRYTLERRLGAGGMAPSGSRVMRSSGAAWRSKALSDTLAGEEGYVRRFRREARVAAGLSHPNLVRVFDFGDDPRPCLVMEYVEGGTLAEHLRKPERELDCNGLVRRLLDALDHVHEARIVHRDVKPANVLMGTDQRAADRLRHRPARGRAPRGRSTFVERVVRSSTAAPRAL